MKRTLLGTLLVVALLVAAGLVAWFVIRARMESPQGSAPGEGSAQGDEGLRIVSEPGADDPGPSAERQALFGDGEPGTPEDRAAVSEEGARRGVILDDDLEGGRVVEFRLPSDGSENANEEEGLVPIPSQTAGTGGGASAPVASGSVDDDGDGLTTDQELQQGTSPQRADTDNDGLNDGDEVRRYRTSPTNRDTDADGLTDGEEVIRWGTDPLNPDTDGDSYLDGAEVGGGYNPNGPGAL